ncbi:MAG TPA: hypothetical protein PLL45_06090 [Thermoflexales bacterium]|nr:hypothetical protein [Thermoflexales bacterium]
MLRGICLITALALLSAVGAPAPAWAAEAPPERMPLGVVVTPPECVTESLFAPPALPTWAFIVNFEVISGSAPLGCLAVYNAAPPDVFYPIPCHTVGSVAYFNGFGLFQGGRVECPINLQTYVTSPPISNTLEVIMMQGVGRLSPTEASTSSFRSPIVYYSPTLAATGTGLFLRASATRFEISGQFRTRLNNTNFEQALGVSVFTTTVSNALAQTWQSIYWRRRMLPDTFTTVWHTVNGGPPDDLLSGPQNPVSFRSDGGTFIVGGSPLGPNLLGTLEEIIVDPAGGSQPPKVASVVPLSKYDIFLPLVQR